MLSGFFKSERSKYTGVIWHVKIKSLGRGHTHKNALDEVGRKMLGARGPRNTIVNFLPLPHLRFCLAACRSKDFPSQGRLLRAEGQEWLLALRQHPLALPPLLVPSLETQPFITGVLYSDHSCFYSYHTLPSLGVENLSREFCGEASTAFLLHSLQRVPNFSRAAPF